MNRVEEINAGGLFEGFSPELKGFARRRLGNAAEAEDVVQEAFLRLHKAQAKGVIESPKGFLYRVTENLVIDRLRRRRLDGGPVAHDPEADSNLVTTITPEDHFSKKQELSNLLRAVNKLPVRPREVFLLGKVEGMTHAEIANLLGISKSTVEKHMMRALLDLDDLMPRRNRGRPDE